MADATSYIHSLTIDDAARLENLRTLNTQFQTETSLLDADQWRGLVEASSYATHIYADKTDQALAFLIAFTSTAKHDNANFQWFAQRYDSFVYIDRIVVSAATQGQGFGRQLYRHLTNWSIQQGIARLCCEVNQEPPNHNSDAFHKRLGFERCGTGTLAQKEKVVAYLTKPLSSSG